ncbi:trypsin-1-like [Chrysoperla carnea]|uniref:trypsin-1-like n=1 Tax=Chrysoperla carnea TaxID=189513 RepID=UPI001D086D80|nr:trypsin-1-like [Chrysoperla carnea]
MKLNLIFFYCIFHKLLVNSSQYQLNPNQQQLYYIPSTGTYIWGGRHDQYLQFIKSTTTTQKPSDSSGSDNDILQCGVRNIDEHLYRQPKIVGGTEPKYGSFPWLIEIAKYDTEATPRQWKHHCGGALLPTRKGDLILTAAHCLQPPIQINELRVIAGDHNLKTHDLHEQIMGVADFIVHPAFRQDGPYSNDIAIIKVRPRSGTNRGFSFTSHVQPICLPTENDTPSTGAWCDVSGWGMTDGDDLDTQSTILQAITVPIIDTAKCRSSTFYGGRQQKILDSMMCAGYLNGGKDACGGDSGGPLACELNGRFHLAGLVSWGDGCAKEHRPGVYTRVNYYANWIQTTIKQLNLR